MYEWYYSSFQPPQRNCSMHFNKRAYRLISLLCIPLGSGWCGGNSPLLYGFSHLEAGVYEDQRVSHASNCNPSWDPYNQKFYQTKLFKTSMSRMKYCFPDTAPPVSHLCIEYILIYLKKESSDGWFIGIDHWIALGERYKFISCRL